MKIQIGNFEIGGRRSFIIAELGTITTAALIVRLR